MERDTVRDNPHIAGALQVVLPMSDPHPESEKSRTEAFCDLVPFACILFFAPPCGVLYSFIHFFYVGVLTERKVQSNEKAANLVMNVFFLISWIPYFNLIYGIQVMKISFSDRNVGFVDAVGPIATYYFFCLWILVVAYRLYRTGLSFEETKSQEHIRTLSEEEQRMFFKARPDDNDGLFTWNRTFLTLLMSAVVVASLRFFNYMTDKTFAWDNVNVYTSTVYWVCMSWVFLGATLAVGVLYYRQMESFKRFHYCTSNSLNAARFRRDHQLDHYDFFRRGFQSWNNVRIVLEKELAEPWSVLNAIFMPTSFMFLVVLVSSSLYLAVAQVICHRDAQQTVFGSVVMMLISLIYFIARGIVTMRISHYQMRNLETVASLYWHLSRTMDVVVRSKRAQWRRDALMPYLRQDSEMYDLRGDSCDSGDDLYMDEANLEVLQESAHATLRVLHSIRPVPRMLGLTPKQLRFFFLYILLLSGNIFYFFITIRLRMVRDLWPLPSPSS